MTGLFSGQVVVVAGGGAGIGRQYCLELARQGASVLVAGRGDSVRDVATEIADFGGVAEACVSDVRDGDAIVAAARGRYGRIDALIVNAGITRDRTFAKMSDDEWREVVDVHLEGAHACARAAWPHMLERRYGRILLTASPAGMYGNFGQANYSAAKGAIVGLMRALSLEGASRNVFVNAISPIAATAMSRDLLSPELSDILAPELVAPFALALIHPQSLENGVLLEAGGGWGAVARWQRSAGVRLEGEDCSVAQVLARWRELASFEEGAVIPANGLATLAAALGPRNVEALRAFLDKTS